MKLVKTLLLLFTLLIFGKTQAQDLHWTMFDMSPLTLNPAFTGAYEGTFRVGGIYRSQWNSVSDATGFETPSFYVDAPILMIGKRGWLGVGGMLYNDSRGSLSLETTAFMGSAALHLGLNKKGTSVISIGVQGGTIQNQLKTDDVLLAEQIVLGGVNDPYDGRFGDDPMNNHLDFSAGLKFTSELSKTADLTLGLSFGHLTTPKNGILSTNTNNNNVDRSLTTSFHGRFNADLSENFILSPGFIYQTTSSLNEIALQVLAGYRLGEKKDMTIYLGPGYRMVDNDAIMAILRFDYKQLRAGIAYDFNTSALNTATNGRGGFEIAASYIARIYKKPTVKPVIFCPRF
jgi:type IX secretion system PorP/SprF family membrane protein